MVAQRRTLPYPKRTAFHEAGHAAVALSLGRRPTSIRVTRARTGVTDGVYSGALLYRPASVRRCVVVALAGVHAEARVTGYSPEQLLRDTGIHDREYVRAALLWLVEGGDEPDMRTAWRRAHADAASAVARSWPAVEALAARLRLRGRLTGRDVAKLLTGKLLQDS